MARFNRNIEISLHSVDGPNFLENKLLDDIEFIGRESRQFLPEEIILSFQKSLTSNPASCTVTISNTNLVEVFHSASAFLVDEFAEFEYSLYVAIGYDDYIEPLFSGDLHNISVSGGASLTDSNLTLTAFAGSRAISLGSINERFPANTTYRAIVGRCFELYDEQFGVELTTLDDPENKLAGAIKKPWTAAGQISRLLNDICRTLDMTWSIGIRDNPTGKQRAFFIDKKSVFDSEGHGAGPHEVNYETGKIGLTSFSKSEFSFLHFPDPKLTLGAEVSVSDYPQINVAAPIVGRINRISGSTGSKSGGAQYRVVCQYVRDGFAFLPPQRRNIGAELLA